MAKLRQNVAPKVLGIISEKYKITKVSKIAIAVSHFSPNMPSACAPTPAAPIV